MVPSHVDGGFHAIGQDDELRWTAVVMGAKAHDVDLGHSGRETTSWPTLGAFLAPWSFSKKTGCCSTPRKGFEIPVTNQTTRGLLILIARLTARNHNRSF